MLSLKEEIAQVFNNEEDKAVTTESVDQEENTKADLGIYSLFESLAQEVDDVTLEGENHKASNLVGLIKSWPVKLVWTRANGWKIKPKPDFEEGYKEFRAKYLAPNTEQVRQLINLANEEFFKQIKELENEAHNKNKAKQNKSKIGA